MILGPILCAARLQLPTLDSTDAYASCWQINPGNPDLRRQSEEVRLIIHTPTGLSLSLSHRHTHAQVCVSLGVSMCDRDNFCQNARMTFLGRNSPLLSEFMAQVDDTIVEAVCRHGTGGGHVDWSSHLLKCSNMID